MPNHYWNPQVELATQHELAELQLKRLRRMLNYVSRNSPFYRNRFKELGLDPDSVNSLSDLRKFPYTTKDDLRKHGYPYGGEFLCVPLNKVRLFHMTSGTTGDPQVGPYTDRDFQQWTDLMTRSCVAAGVHDGDIAMNAYGYGLFTGGEGFHQGLRGAGAAVIPWSAGRTEGLVKSMKDFRASVLSCTPSYALYIAETARKMGVDPAKELNLRLVLAGAEIWDEGVKRRIEEGFGLKERGGGARNVYGATEMYGPGTGIECESGAGFHVWTDHFYLEVIDPETLDPVAPGEQGEMVVTTLTKEAMPLIRYRLRDMTVLNEEPCDCGRNQFPRCMWVRGRLDDVIQYKGAKVWPSTIQETLLRFAEVQEFQVVVDKTTVEYTFVINVEVSDRATEETKHRIASELRKVLYVKFDIAFFPPGSLPRYEGKAKRVLVKA